MLSSVISFSGALLLEVYSGPETTVLRDLGGLWAPSSLHTALPAAQINDLPNTPKLVHYKVHISNPALGIFQ